LKLADSNNNLNNVTAVPTCYKKYPAHLSLSQIRLLNTIVSKAQRCSWIRHVIRTKLELQWEGCCVVQSLISTCQEWWNLPHA